MDTKETRIQESMYIEGNGQPANTSVYTHDGHLIVGITKLVIEPIDAEEPHKFLTVHLTIEGVRFGSATNHPLEQKSATFWRDKYEELQKERAGERLDYVNAVNKGIRLGQNQTNNPILKEHFGYEDGPRYDQETPENTGGTKTITYDSAVHNEQCNIRLDEQPCCSDTNHADKAKTSITDKYAELTNEPADIKQRFADHMVTSGGRIVETLHIGPETKITSCFNEPCCGGREKQQDNYKHALNYSRSVIEAAIKKALAKRGIVRED